MQVDFFPGSQGSSTFTYLVGCTKSHQAVLIDPVLWQFDYPREFWGSSGEAKREVRGIPFRQNYNLNLKVTPKRKLKMDGWKMIHFFLRRRPIFRGYVRLVSGRCSENRPKPTRSKRKRSLWGTYDIFISGRNESRFRNFHLPTIDFQEQIC